MTATIDTLDSLQAVLTGRLRTPADADWETVRRGWNLAIDQHPRAVVEAADAHDVVATVRYCADNGIRVTAQSSGHGASLSYQGAVLIRTSGLNDIWIDGDARVARVGAGVKWADLLSALDGTGLIALCGSNADVSPVGMTLGGGLSWFSRKYGYSAGAVRAFEIVDARGTHRWITDETDPTLTWALRGGGGAFAIVTSVEIELKPEPQVYGGKLMFPIGDAANVWRTFTEVTATAPEELSVWVSVAHFPPMPELPEPIRGKSFAAIDATFLGAAEEAERLLAPFRAAGTIVHDTMRMRQPSEFGDIAEEPTNPTPAKFYSTLLREFDASTAERVLEVVGETNQYPFVNVMVRHIGGALSRPSARRSVADSVQEPYVLFALGVVAVPEMVAGMEAGFGALLRATEAEATDTSVFTFLNEDEPIARAYPDDRPAHLHAVKAAVDPSGLFVSNRPGRLTGE